MLTLPLVYRKTEAGSTLVNVYLPPANADPSPTLTMSEEGLHQVSHAPVGVTLTQLKSNVALGLDTEPMVALVISLGLS